MTDIPKLLRELDPQVLRRLEGLADLLMQKLLDRRSNPRPAGMFPEAVRYPRGTTMFQGLHRFASETEALVLLLNRAAERLTKTQDRLWQVTLADPAVYLSFGENSVEIMLHPADVDVVGIQEVPTDVRIFRLSREGAFEITELVPFTPSQIARERYANPLTELRQRWQHNRDTYCAAVAQRVGAELTRRQDELDPQIVNEIKNLLVKAVTSGYYLVDALEAASHLSILAEVTGNFGQQAE